MYALACCAFRDGSDRALTGIIALSGPPDVIFLDCSLGRLYVAAGDPGVVDVIEPLATHTTALDVRTHQLSVFLPRSHHRAAVFVDG